MDMAVFLMWLFIFSISVYFLFQSSNFFTRAAEEVGVAIGIPPFIVGLTIVAIGTSLPELFTSFLALHQQAGQMVAANAIGSNVTNILLILGALAAIFGKISTFWKKLTIDLPILMILSLLTGLFFLDGRVGRLEGFLLFSFIVLYLFFTFKFQKPIQFLGKTMPRKKIKISSFLILFGSAAVLYISAKYTVESAVQLALLFGLSYSAVGATLVALGTSLPELSVSLVAGWKKKTDIALGNIIGSNIFNLGAVIGLPALIFGLRVERQILVFAYPAMILATFMFILFIRDRTVRRSEGIFLLFAYGLFLAKMLHSF